MLGFVFILMFVAVLWLVFWGIYRRVNNQPVIPKPENNLSPIERNYFNLHFRPYLEIKRNLPTLPAGYMWELSTKEDSYYGLMIVIKLLELMTENEIASRDVNLKIDPSDTLYTYSERYITFQTAHHRTKPVWRGVVEKNIAWCQAEKQKLQTEFYRDHREIIS